MSDLGGLAAEMAKQASLGHKRFCIGVHVHEGGAVEEEWIDWTQAFANLDALRSTSAMFTREELEAVARVAFKAGASHYDGHPTDEWVEMLAPHAVASYLDSREATA